MKTEPCLQKSDFTIDDEVWKEIGEDFDRGVDDYVKNHPHVPETFLRHLVQKGLELQEGGGQSFWERHRLDFLALLGVLAVVFICLWVQEANIFTWLTRVANPEPVLITTKDIPAYTLLASDNVTVTTSIPSPADALHNMDQVLGHVTLKPLAAGAPITQTEVLSIPVSLDGYWLIGIPLTPTSTVPAEPGQQITLIGNTQANEDASLSATAWLVAAERERILVAMPEAAARRAAELISRDGRFTIIRPLGRSP